ncbi:MAG: deoxynucleoside kinase [Mycoplasmataceae bacterium]|nr:deoxynucleoside kinase [Mycoplasmataceae bacterium]
MKKIALSGTSGTGKSTLLKSYSTDFLTIKELKGDKSSICDFYYELSTKEDRHGTNLFISSLLAQRFIDDSSIGEDVIFDRWIIDYIVAAELRVKPYNLYFFDYLVSIFEDMMDKIKQYPEYIILKTSYPEFKKRILKRGRENEKESILNDETWYKNYHRSYNKVLIKYLKKFDIKYSIIDSTNLNKRETKMIVDKIIDNIE